MSVNIISAPDVTGLHRLGEHKGEVRAGRDRDVAALSIDLNLSGVGRRGGLRLVLREGKPPAKVDHFAIGVDNFKKETVTADLKARGVTPIDQQGGGFGFHVVDPDGYPVQISANNGQG